MKSKRFEDAFSGVTLSGEVRERIFDAALAETEGRAGAVRRASRPLRAALAAALAVCLLTGTALAVSPALRELLWGGFEPYAQELEPTPENTQVYDGVEARIVSALSDGHINILHVELRDTRGGRVRRLWDEYSQTGGQALSDVMTFSRIVTRSGDEEDRLIKAYGHFSIGDSGTGRSARAIGFDEETGVMTVELLRTTAAPLDRARKAVVEIKSGAAGTEVRSVEHSAPDSEWTRKIIEDDVVIIEERGKGDTWTEILNGWELAAELACLPVRTVDVGGIAVPSETAHMGVWDPEKAGLDLAVEDPDLHVRTVEISQLGVTLCRDPDRKDSGGYEIRMPYDELTVSFKDGETRLCSVYDSTFNVNDSLFQADSWLFPEPVDPESVTSVTLGGVEIPLG